MNLIDKVKSRARVNLQRIVLPEGEDPRILAAAAQAATENLANVTVLGNERLIRAVAEAHGVALGAVMMVDPATSPLLEKEASFLLYERTRARGVTFDEAHQTARLPGRILPHLRSLPAKPTEL